MRYMKKAMFIVYHFSREKKAVGAANADWPTPCAAPLAFASL